LTTQSVSRLIESTSDGTVSGTPRLWLRLEAAALLTGSLIAYSTTGQHWWLVPVVVLLPDLAITGYVGGTRIGALLYNLAHATPVPALVIGLGWWQHRPLLLGLGLVWLAHIGLDRLMGYGLKYDDHSQHTHLGMLGGIGWTSKRGTEQQTEAFRQTTPPHIHPIELRATTRDDAAANLIRPGQET